jgi:hypothetical protein
MVRADSLTALVLALCMVQQVTAQAKLTFETVPTRGRSPGMSKLSRITRDGGHSEATMPSYHIHAHYIAPGRAYQGARGRCAAATVLMLTCVLCRARP